MGTHAREQYCEVHVGKGKGHTPACEHLLVHNRAHAHRYVMPEALDAEGSRGTQQKSHTEMHTTIRREVSMSMVAHAPSTKQCN